MNFQLSNHGRGVWVARMCMLDLVFGQQLIEVSTCKRQWWKVEPPVHKLCVRAALSAFIYICVKFFMRGKEGLGLKIVIE